MRTAIGIALVTLVAAPLAADWEPGDPHKMHYPQLPRAGGWDVAFNQGRLADDWECSKTGPVSDVHFWISWEADQVQDVTGFSIRIHSDAMHPDGYSIPADDFLYEHDFGPAEFTVQMMPSDLQGWFDPFEGIFIPDDHSSWAQINVVDMPEPIVQHEGEVYWLEIDGFGLPGAGWKESGSPQFRDDAVFWVSPQWLELRDPITQNSLDLAFVITPEPGALFILALGGLTLLRRRP
jgi:uncharacterized protein YbdZ (MbtH family)